MEINLTTYPLADPLHEVDSLSPSRFLETLPEPSSDEQKKGSVKWFDFSGTLDPAVAERLTDIWKLHALAVGAATASTRNSRLQEYADHLLLGWMLWGTLQDSVPCLRRIWVAGRTRVFYDIP